MASNTDKNVLKSAPLRAGTVHFQSPNLWRKSWLPFEDVLESLSIVMKINRPQRHPLPLFLLATAIVLATASVLDPPGLNVGDHYRLIFLTSMQWHSVASTLSYTLS